MKKAAQGPLLGSSVKESFLLVELDRFQGPMDLLLHLIRHQDIDLFDIPIATITVQFLAAVEEIRVEDLDGAGEFLEMAATLIRIKAQMLLPRPVLGKVTENPGGFGTKRRHLWRRPGMRSWKRQ